MKFTAIEAIKRGTLNFPINELDALIDLVNSTELIGLLIGANLANLKQVTLQKLKVEQTNATIALNKQLKGNFNRVVVKGEQNMKLTEDNQGNRDGHR